MKRWALVFTAIAMAMGTIPAEAPETGRGAELLKPFKNELQGALRAGLSQGPDEAIGVCKTRAPEIAESLSTDGVRMGRTSHKLRNPSNTAPEWVGPILEAYLSDPASRHPREIALPEGRFGYAEPIMIKTVCLACHGENVAPEVASRIAEHYPNDRATGFKNGDFRGLFWVEYPAHK